MFTKRDPQSKTKAIIILILWPETEVPEKYDLIHYTGITLISTIRLKQFNALETYTYWKDLNTAPLLPYSRDALKSNDQCQLLGGLCYAFKSVPGISR